jgi:multidrug efflux system membrane fusion protein
VFLLVGCTPSGNDAEKAKQGFMPEVKVANPISQEVIEWDEFTGHIEAVNAVDVRARVSGYLDKVAFKAGDKVKKGDLLFVIDPKPYQAQLNFAMAELAQAKTKQELAKNDFSRAERLYSAKGISAEEHDARSKAMRESLGAVQSAQANVETAKLNLDYCEIRSPIEGRITRELITLGNLVNGGGAEPTLLATIVSINPVYVYVDADESAVLKYRRLALKDGQDSMASGKVPTALALADEDGFPHQGHLDYVAPREDSATGTVSLRAVFDNPEELLSPGFFARLRVRGSLPYQALVLPEKAIAQDQGQRFVWLVESDGQVAYRKITVGVLQGTLRVITDGVQASDVVVVEGIQRLKPGLKVKSMPISIAMSKKEDKP